MKDQDRRDLLLAEYEFGLQGYHHRDVLIQDEFGKMVATFFAFLALAGGVKALELSQLLDVAISVFIGAVGLASLVAFFIDLQSNSSAKMALRWRGAEIERTLGTLAYWRTISRRRYFRIERWYKRPKKGFEGSATTLFVYAGQFMIVLWLVVTGVFVVL